MTTLLPLGTAIYNGITFTTIIASKMIYKPVYDAAKRTVVYTECRWDVQGTVSAGTYGEKISDSFGYLTDGDSSHEKADINTIRRQLLQPGGALTIIGHGIGDNYVNVGNIKDVVWGPQPELLEIQPFGGRSFFVRYALTWRIPTNCINPASRRSILEFNFDWSVAIDKGLTVRTITGHIIIAQTRSGVNDRNVLDNADRYREKLVPPVPVGFQRTQNWKMDASKNRLDFTLTDTELATQNALPEGITQADVTADLEGNTTYGQGGKPVGYFVDWDWTISGSLTVAPNMPTSWAWQKFMMILSSRYRWLQANKGNLGGLPGGTINAHLRLTPTHFRASEQIFGLTSTFSVGYRIQAFSSFKTILRASGLWLPIEGTSHVAWNYSMEASAHAARGRAGLFFEKDTIVDLCMSTAEFVFPGVSSSAYLALQPNGPGCEDINTQNSWMDWRNMLHTRIMGGTVFHKPIGLNQTLIKQVKHDDHYLVVMQGYAQRAGYQIPIPKLLTVNGRKVTQVGSNGISNEVVGQWCGYPIYFSSWQLIYQMDKAPVEQKSYAIPNPYFNTKPEPDVTANQAQ